MSRLPRIFSYTSFYHVIVRGIGKQILFEENADYRFYLSILKKHSIETNIRVYAYCLMENHVHILLYDPEKNLSLLMKKIGVCYAHFFNKKYERTGHLFQDRYLSEPVETEAYLLTVYRYILKNPEKAGICTPKNYPWSSYHEYTTIPDFLQELIASKGGFESFISENDSCDCMEYESIRQDDKWAEKIIRQQLKGKSGTILQNYDRRSRNQVLHSLKEAGLSIRQIERLTGINRGVIQKA